MARYRPVLTSIWVCDDKFQDYSPEGKLLFLYLITNEHINEAGIYKITFKTIANETDIPKERVIKLIKGELSNNISYDSDNNVIFVHKFLKFNGGGNPKLLKKSIEKDRELIKTSLWEEFDLCYSKDLKPLDNSFKTVCQHTVSNSISNSNSLINDNSIKRYNDKEKCSEKYSELIFNFEKQEWENITDKDRERWEKTYPACDIEFELNKMADWLISNPNKKKKKYRAFISRWLSRVQESGGTKGIKSTQKEFDELLEKIESKNKGKK